MKIILIAGTWYKPQVYTPMWANIEAAFLTKYPDAMFSQEAVYFWPWEVKKIQGFSRRIVEKNDTGGDVILVGHSMGGIIACGIATLFKKSNVLGIVTLMAPHTMFELSPLFDFYGFYFSEPPAFDIPVVSFGGKYDFTVPHFFTKHPRANYHNLLGSGHHYFFGPRQMDGKDDRRSGRLIPARASSIASSPGFCPGLI